MFLSSGYAVLVFSENISTSEKIDDLQRKETKGKREKWWGFRAYKTRKFKRERKAAKRATHR